MKPSTAGFDEPTTTWFTAFCTGVLKAAVDNKKSSAILKGTLTAASKAPLLASYQVTAGDWMAVAAAVRTLPPPTVAGGAKVASDVPKASTTVAAAVTALAAQTQAVDATKDPTQLLALAEAKQASLQADGTAVFRPINEMSAASQQMLLKIPVCSQMQTVVTGG